MIDPIGGVETDPVARLRDVGLVIQQPERERIAIEIERLRAEVAQLWKIQEKDRGELARLRSSGALRE